MKKGQKRNRGSSKDDFAVLKACWEQQPGAWEQFLERFGRLIYYGIHRTCQLKGHEVSPAEVEDLFHDVLVHLLKEDCKRLRQYRGTHGATVATWIRTITVRFTIDYLRSQGKVAEFVDIEEEGVSREVSFTNPVARPDQDYEDKEEMERFVKALESLSENDRNFIELYYHQALSAQEVAALLGISVKTVYTKINRIKEKLKEAVEKI